MLDKLKEILEDHRLYHSKFQQDHFITKKSGGTVYGQYKQALRETYKRWRGLREGMCDKEKLLVEIDEQKELSEKEEGFKQRHAEIEYKRKVMQMEETERVLKDTEREFKRFYQQAVMLKEKLGDISEERRERLEEEMFVYKLKEMMVTDWMCYGRNSAQTHELLCSLPYETRKEIVRLTSGETDKERAIKQGMIVQEYYEENRCHFDDSEELDIDVKCLLEL